MEKGGPEPAQLLHACKSQVAELELWLQQASVAFEPETLNADMQQVVEQQLVSCQVRLMPEFLVCLLTNHLPRQGDFSLKVTAGSSPWDPSILLGPSLSFSG